jgi:FAD/FMN-containing dehydrogenase
MSGAESWRGDVASLEDSTRGWVLLRGDEHDDRSRRVFSAMIDRFPALILRCADEGDVVQGVELARKHGLPVSVRGGGHSVAGSAIGDGGLALDTSAMTTIVVDLARGRGGGAPPAATVRSA